MPQRVSSDLPSSRRESDTRRTIGEINSLSRNKPINEFKMVCFELIKQHIPFDSGAWLAGALTKTFMPHCVHLHNQKKEFMHSGMHCWSQDLLSQAAMLNKGLVMDLQKTMVRHPDSPRREFDRHLGKFKIRQALCVAHYNWRNNLYTLISIYRTDANLPFSPAERACFQYLAFHLTEAYRNNLCFHLIADHPRMNAAIADRQGCLHDAGPAFLALAELEWSDFPRHRIPLQIDKVLNRGDKGVYLGKQVVFELTACHDMICIAARKRSRNDLLTERERQVCKYLVRGCAYKDVANKLGISCSTVTNHANRIYKKLGVQGKVSLARRLSSLFDE